MPSLKTATFLLIGTFAWRQVVPRDSQGRVLEEKVEAAVKLAPFSALVSASVAAVVVGTSWQYGLHLYLLCFIGVVETTAATILVGCARWRLSRHRLDATKIKNVAAACASLLGIVWASVPVVLFPDAGSHLRLLIACTMAGLLCTGLVIAPLKAAAGAFVTPLLAGSTIGLCLTGDIFYEAIALLLGIYALFIASSIVYLDYLFTVQVLQKIQLEEQAEMIRLLLWDYDQSASDWFWETDSDGRLRHVSPRLAQALDRHPHLIEGASFFEALSSGAGETIPYSDRQQLMTCFAEQVFFRDVLVPVWVGSEKRWWSLTGRPFFHDEGGFRGYRGVGSDVTNARAADARNAYQARHDELTGLANRTCFMDAVWSACERAGTSGKSCALLSLDLDGFKRVNDALGHPVGDELLRAIGRRLVSVVREPDMVFRLGGDEFAVLHFDCKIESAAALAARIVETLGKPFSFHEAEIAVSASVGIALTPGNGEQADDLVRNADLALYTAKDEGKSTFRFFDGEPEASPFSTRFLARDLLDAKKEGQLRLVFQPIVNAQTLAVRGFEALLRWEHPRHGLLPPDQFIALAEEAGLLGNIGEWVLREACSEALAWPENLRVAVNVSATQFQDPNFAVVVSDVLAATRLPSSRLELEVTESVFMDSSSLPLQLMHQLRALGIRVALDDFGTGFSSLGYLRSFPFDKIKIDGGFVREMMTDRRNAMIVHAIISLAANLGVATTAEGVETIEHLQQLRSQGCTEAQGYLFSRPIPADMIIEFLRNHQTVKSLDFIPKLNNPRLDPAFLKATVDTYVRGGGKVGQGAVT
jgi:diguanylate cyclase (GGDEF)-like protein